MYFQMFPLMPYSFPGDYNSVTVTDICKRVKVKDRILTTAQLYEPYYVRDGESPHVLADKFYGTSTLHWIILLTNKIIDPNFDWPMDETVLKEYVKNKYPGTFVSGMDNIPNYYAVHHYALVSPHEWRNGMYMPTPEEIATFDPEYVAKLYDAATEQIVPITNYEYEEEVNDNKRQIQLFRTELVGDLIREFTALIRT